MVDAPSVLVEQDRAVAFVTLNRPAARNALSRDLVARLQVVAQTLASHGELRAVVLAGAGDKAFCAGADLIERQTMTGSERTAHTGSILAAVEAIAALPVPVIAAVQGYALAGGAELALAADIRIAAAGAVFGFPEVRIGIFPGAGGVARLPRLVGSGVANDLLFTGRQIDAEEALRIGLVNRVVGAGSVIDAAREVALTIAANGPLGVRAVKAALRSSVGLPVAEANAAIARYRRPLDDTLDYTEGLRAFSEKRAPRFTGK